jgi:uncharacterized membrane protein YphA (DoxX/SURF4 family)
MRILTVVIRLLLGLAFLVFGLNAFLQFMPVPELPHNASGDFLNALFRSGYVYAIGACQVVGGLLLLLGRFVPLGLTILGPIVVNIVLFHTFMDRSGLLIALLFTALWLFLVWRWWSAFAGLFRA